MNATWLVLLVLGADPVPVEATDAVIQQVGHCKVCDGGYNEFSSPCRTCHGKRHCKTCCKDSTCDMFPHYPYPPEFGGYYYFRPYNFSTVLQQQQIVAEWGLDPRSPYSRALFIPVYEQFENTTYEPNSKPSQTLDSLPEIGLQLPDLEELVRLNQSGVAPLAPAPAPAPQAIPE